MSKVSPFGTLAALAICAGSAAFSGTLTTTLGAMQLDTMVEGLDVPWGFAFLPEGGVLITEREGALLFSKGGQTHQVSGMPKVEADGQGGLLDIMLPRDFSATREVFFTFSKRQGSGSGTALAKGRLSKDLRQINDVDVIFEATPSTSGGRHFGSRIVEAPDGSLFVTLGERGDRPSAQDLGREQGSIIRINRDGSIPGDNPFVGYRRRKTRNLELWSPQPAGHGAGRKRAALGGGTWRPRRR